jgi:L,D-peptidoglycan transpeptidase YkuD (ErfK/YbiS/YcfS/YnhG family)
LTPEDLVLTPAGLRFHGRLIPCTIGRGGIVSEKCEGDGSTPAGTLVIVGMLYRPDRVARPASWAQPIGPRDLWSDDAADPDYNRRVRAPHGFSHERLRRGDRLYDVVLLTDWNLGRRPGGGSAIFLHRWRRPGVPTEGCIAMAPLHLRWVAKRVAPGSRIVIRPGASSARVKNHVRH